VRFISNRSSGRSGLYLVKEALQRGIPGIIFITGPTCFDEVNPNYMTIKVETALQMQEQVSRFSNDADVIIMAAAVGDYRVAHYAQEKIKKGQDTLSLHLVKNPDILFELGQKKKICQILVGYAAETDHIFENAREKFKRKNLDLLVLNQISENNPAFNVESNQVYFLTGPGTPKVTGVPGVTVTPGASGDFQRLEMMDKSQLASLIWDEIFKIDKNKTLINHS
ncbi:MAG: hypothetical protein MUF15_17975, partial [Acidobacteria bacterium]|nr:hypothetical protein [Acidobacteriota bacterium]